MKKIIFSILVVFIFMMNINVYALSTSKYETTQPNINKLSTGIIEDVNVYQNNRVIDYVEAIYTIPEGYYGDITIVSSIFDEVAKSDGYMPKDGIEVRISIINKSKYEYDYIDKSVILSTEDLTNYNLEKVESAFGFNNQEIVKAFTPNRTANTAIQSLYGVSSAAKIRKSMVTNEELSEKLREKGYNGVDELDKYYLDFYNAKYNQNVLKLEDFSNEIISELFNGNCLFIKEENKQITELGYDYWYNKLFSWNFIDQDCNDLNSENYSIGSHMRDNTKINTYFKSDIGHIDILEEKDLTDAYLKINGLYTTNAFMDYKFSAYLEFSLKMNDDMEKEKNESNTVEEVINTNIDDSIIPPNTGI